MNIDDGDIFMAEFTNGAIGSIQTSYVTVGNYPGIEARIYGEEGAIICRLVEEFGIAETIKVAPPDAVEFERAEDSRALLPDRRHARESWRSLFYANLIANFIDEIVDGGGQQPGQLRRRRGGPGGDQRRGALVPGAAVGGPAARGVAVATSDPSRTTGAPAFTVWLDDFLASFYRHRPVTATYAGIHDYDDRLPDYSEAGVAAVLTDTESLLARLAALPPEPLSTVEALDRRVAEGFLRTQLWEYDSPHFRWANPSLHTGEAIFGIIVLLQEQTPAANRLELVAARLGAIPALLAQARESVRSAPAAWIERARRESAAAAPAAGRRPGLLPCPAQPGVAVPPRCRRPGDAGVLGV